MIFGLDIKYATYAQPIHKRMRKMMFGYKNYSLSVVFLLGS